MRKPCESCSAIWVSKEVSLKDGRLRKSVLAIGFLMILGGGFVLNQGEQILTPIAQVLGLVSNVPTERVLIPPTLLAVAASNHTFLTAPLEGGVQVTGSLQVSGGRDVAFYVMDEGNFLLWRAGQPSSIIIANPAATVYNLTFTTQSAGTYYFVFDNQDTTRRTVIFSLDVVENRLVTNPIINYAGYELLVIGILLAFVGIRTGSKRTPEPELKPVTETGLRCRFCHAEISPGQTFCESCGRSQQ